MASIRSAAAMGGGIGAIVGTVLCSKARNYQYFGETCLLALIPIFLLYCPVGLVAGFFMTEGQLDASIAMAVRIMGPTRPLSTMEPKPAVFKKRGPAPKVHK
uniref:ARAD1D20702p n=1 Tax=Blastobotrys adeninivorans TaxID=409370 RepID=A0A060TG65_BLAAD